MNMQMIQGFMLSVVSPDTKYQAFSGDAWLKAAEVALFGMAMVFLVLAVLWAVLAVFKLLFAGSGEKKKESEPEAPAPAVTVTEPAPVADVQDDGELIAVITAAIEAYRASESGGDENYAEGFRVVSFRRAGAGRPWNSK